MFDEDEHMRVDDPEEYHKILARTHAQFAFRYQEGSHQWKKHMAAAVAHKRAIKHAYHFKIALNADHPRTHKATDGNYMKYLHNAAVHYGRYKKHFDKAEEASEKTDKEHPLVLSMEMNPHIGEYYDEFIKGREHHFEEKGNQMNNKIRNLLDEAMVGWRRPKNRRMKVDFSDPAVRYDHPLKREAVYRKYPDHEDVVGHWGIHDVNEGIAKQEGDEWLADSKKAKTPAGQKIRRRFAMANYSVHKLHGELKHELKKHIDRHNNPSSVHPNDMIPVDHLIKLSKRVNYAHHNLGWAAEGNTHIRNSTRLIHHLHEALERYRRLHVASHPRYTGAAYT